MKKVRKNEKVKKEAKRNLERKKIENWKGVKKCEKSEEKKWKMCEKKNVKIKRKKREKKSEKKLIKLKLKIILYFLYFGNQFTLICSRFVF